MSLLTSAQVAQALGVGISSVKRWADEGAIRCTKTAGGHRRFRAADVEAFAATANQDGNASRIDTWIRVLADNAATADPYAMLIDERAEHGSWASTCDALAPVMVEIGERWRRGELSILEEHIASERLARALARASEEIPVAVDAPRALLVMAEGDLHTLGLSLLEPCLREAGIRPQWAGRYTPFSTVRAAVHSGRFDLVAVAASPRASADELGALCRRYVRLCSDAGVGVLFGGSGPWPAAPGFGHRISRLSQLDQTFAGASRSAGEGAGQ